VFGRVWFNDRLNSVAQTNNDLTDQLRAAEQREAEVMAAIKTQQDMTYKPPLMSANPGSTVSLLERTGAWTSARGVMMVSQTGTNALLLVVDLPLLPADKVYQVWLMKGRAKYNPGWFTVDGIRSDCYYTRGSFSGVRGGGYHDKTCWRQCRPDRGKYPEGRSLVNLP